MHDHRIIADATFVWHLFAAVGFAALTILLLSVCYIIHEKHRNITINTVDPPEIIGKKLFFLMKQLTPLVSAKKELRTTLEPTLFAHLANDRTAKWTIYFFITGLFLSPLIPLIASDRPLVIKYKEQYLFPIFHNFPEERFGGFLARTDYRDYQIYEEINEHGWQVWTPVTFSYGTHNLYLCSPTPSPPTSTTEFCRGAARELAHRYPHLERNWLGTDPEGRDVLATLLYASRHYMYLVLTSCVISGFIAILLSFLSFITDLSVGKSISWCLHTMFNSLPILLIAWTLCTFLADTEYIIVIIMIATSSISLTQSLTKLRFAPRNLHYFMSSVAMGQTSFGVWRHHLLATNLETCLVLLPGVAIRSLGLLICLDYIGGVLPVGSPSLGSMLRSSAGVFLIYPWLALPTFCTALMLFGSLACLDYSLRRASTHLEWQRGERAQGSNLMYELRAGDSHG